MKERLGPFPENPEERELRPAELEGKRAAQARNAQHPGQKERVEAAWRKKREEERKRKEQERKDKEQMETFWSRIDEDEHARRMEELQSTRARLDFDSEEEREAEEEQNQRKKEWKEKQRREKQKKKEEEEEDDDITKAKRAMKDKYVMFRRKQVFGQAINEEMQTKMYEAVRERERYMKDDTFCEGLFEREIGKLKERIDILREGRDSDSPVRKTDDDDVNEKSDKEEMDDQD